MSEQATDRPLTARDVMTNVAPVPRVALTRTEAAAALGMSLDSFQRHAQPDIRIIRRGRLRLVPVTELARWAEQAAERAI